MTTYQQAQAETARSHAQAETDLSAARTRVSSISETAAALRDGLDSIPQILNNLKEVQMPTPTEDQIIAALVRIENKLNRLLGLPAEPRPLAAEIAALQEKADEYLGEISRSLDAMTNRTDHKKQ